MSLSGADPRDPVALVVGDDVRVRAVGQLRVVRRPRQHVLHLLAQEPRGQRARLARAARTHRLPLLLQVRLCPFATVLTPDSDGEVEVEVEEGGGDPSQVAASVFPASRALSGSAARSCD